ncbi:hypothetical protein GDO81_017467 [Engystomops pustulosus]|uniref:Uncharacterized protein n=1 Tax=Engystomops pustulosus TaxID=76066 RepID=A0AAV7AKZ1_ENGPU|nr:hypothetical protein GDO81_017467 [Engystomops pustulosus]
MNIVLVTLVRSTWQSSSKLKYVFPLIRIFLFYYNKHILKGLHSFEDEARAHCSRISSLGHDVKCEEITSLALDNLF